MGEVAGLYILFAIIAYLLPTLIALCREYRVGTVFLFNLFLGWTAIGWFVMLFLAAFGKTEKK